MGFFTYYVASLASMGGFLFGWDTGQISDLLVMEDFKNRFAQSRQPDGSMKWNEWIQGLVVGMFSIGAIAGAIVGAPLSDKLGRRLSIVIGCIVFTVGLIVQVASEYSWGQLGAGRLIVGLSVGWLSSAVPTYQAETVPRQVRGALVGTYQLFITIGILLSYCACYGTRHYAGSAQWRIPIGIGFAWGLILGIGILFCPESPRWLAKRGRYDEARRVLAKMRGVDEDNSFVVTEFYEICEEVEQEKKLTHNASFIDCFRPRQKALFRTIIGMAIQMGQQLTGANYFFYYGATIFAPVKIMGDNAENNGYVAQMILGAVNVVTTIPGLIAIDKFGRRTCMMIGAAWMCMWLIVFASVGVTHMDGQGNVTESSVGIAMICSACFYILGFASTWGLGAWVICTELAVPEIRAMQMALSTTSNWTWNFLLGFFTPAITQNIHFYYGYVFVGCTLADFLLIYFFVYETSNLDLEAIQMMYMNENVKPWNSPRWVPPGFQSRDEAARDLQAVKQGIVDHSLNNSKVDVSDTTAPYEKTLASQVTQAMPSGHSMA